MIFDFHYPYSVMRMGKAWEDDEYYVKAMELFVCWLASIANGL
jgi:hypothetical protein